MAITSPITLLKFELGIPCSIYEVSVIFTRRRLLTIPEEFLLLASQKSELQDLTLNQLAQLSMLNQAMLHVAYTQMLDLKVLECTELPAESTSSPAESTSSTSQHECCLRDLRLSVPFGEQVYQQRYIPLQDQPQILQVQYNQLTQAIKFDITSLLSQPKTQIPRIKLDNLDLNLPCQSQDLQVQELIKRELEEDTQSSKPNQTTSNHSALQHRFVSGMGIISTELTHQFAPLEVRLDVKQGLVLTTQGGPPSIAQPLAAFLADSRNAAFLYTNVVQELFPHQQQGKNWKQIAQEYHYFTPAQQSKLQHTATYISNGNEFVVELLPQVSNNEKSSNLEAIIFYGTSQEIQLVNRDISAHELKLHLENLATSATVHKIFSNNNQYFTPEQLLVDTHYQQQRVSLEVNLMRENTIEWHAVLERIFTYVSEHLESQLSNPQEEFTRLLAWCLQRRSLNKLVPAQLRTNIQHLYHLQTAVRKYMKGFNCSTQLRTHLVPFTSHAEVKFHHELWGDKSCDLKLLDPTYLRQILTEISSSPNKLTPELTAILAQLHPAFTLLHDFLKDYNHNLIWKHLRTGQSKAQALRNKTLTEATWEKFHEQLRACFVEAEDLLAALQTPSASQDAIAPEVQLICDLVSNNEALAQARNRFPSQEQHANHQRLIQVATDPEFVRLVTHLQEQGTRAQALRNPALQAERLTQWLATCSEILTADTEQLMAQLEIIPPTFLALCDNPATQHQARAQLVTRLEQEHFAQLEQLLAQDSTHRLLNHLQEGERRQALADSTLSLENLEELIAQVRAVTTNYPLGLPEYFIEANTELAVFAQLAYDPSFQTQARHRVVPQQQHQVYAQAQSFLHLHEVQALYAEFNPNHIQANSLPQLLPTQENFQGLIEKLQQLWYEYPLVLPAHFVQAEPQLEFLHQLAFRKSLQSQILSKLLSNSQIQAAQESIKLLHNPVYLELVAHLQNQGSAQAATHNDLLISENLDKLLDDLRVHWQAVAPLPEWFITANPQIKFLYELSTQESLQHEARSRLVTRTQQELRSVDTSPTQELEITVPQELQAMLDELYEMNEPHQQNHQRNREAQNVQEQLNQQYQAHIEQTKAAILADVQVQMFDSTALQQLLQQVKSQEQVINDLSLQLQEHIPLISKLENLENIVSKLEAKVPEISLTTYKQPTQYTQGKVLYVVTDTNLWLKTQELSNALKEFASMYNVKLIIAKQVLDELDQKKIFSKNRPELAQLANIATSVIDKMIQAQTALVHENSNVQIAKLLELDQYQNPDYKIIAAALDLREKNHGNVVVLTGDNNMNNILSLYKFDTFKTLEALQTFMQHKL